MKNLYSQDDCTLCMACANACPKQAIILDRDAYNYEKIVIDHEKCIHCHLCENVCSQRKLVERHTPINAYAAQATNSDALLKSASGGAFQMIAEVVLENGGACYGCTGEKANGQFIAKHFRIDCKEMLPKILNSKYIVSIIGDSYRMVENDLKNGKLVLFSGTPCQIQGLKAYLNKDYLNLLTADLVCHGVTSTQIFNDYVSSLEAINKIHIEDYTFRDKSISWGTNYRYSYYFNRDVSKKIRIKHCPREDSSYMMHYLRGNIFRENCYSCTLANTNRVSDFTLGDYWEIEKAHPEFVTKLKPRMNLRKGISCILMNTQKAKEFKKALETKMIIHEVELASVVEHNGNLRKSSAKGKSRARVLEKYKNEGYTSIEIEYQTQLGSKKYLYIIKNFLKSYLPDWLRVFIFRRIY